MYFEVCISEQMVSSMSYELRKNVSMVETEYGTVLLDGAQGSYWNLNATATEILKNLLTSDLNDTAHSIAEQFSIDLATSLSDTQQLVSELESAGLVAKRTTTPPLR
ncbi:lasso peptide biosynthesis PqqD family chaperone [Rhodococcus sp. 2G]|uniref:lasso peptide biosynthesis PqqD family chaperone n=1 Tax=Rhodococcus sp. 2G TaxID=1570939 RepID=UPI0012EBEC70|nr:lasso peptide biosynthesis PqqD family chaperone [Rhodococcus sp. 2G]